jgi:hypothetical protein
MIFTYADPIDLVLNIKKNDGVPEGFTAAVAVTNQSGAEILKGQTSLKPFTNASVSVKDIVDVGSITASGNYQVKLTLTNASGKQEYLENLLNGILFGN